MLWSFKLSVCLLAVVCGLSSKAPTEHNERKAMGSYFQDMTSEAGMQKDSDERQFQCRWNCQTVGSDLVNMIQTIVITERRKLRLAFHYEKTVEDDCVKRISRNSNGNLTEYWQLWLVNNTLPSFGGKVIRSFLTLIQASFEDQVKVWCHFRNSNSSGKGTLSGELSPPSEHLENILRSTVKSLGEVCDAQSENDVQTCIQIRRFNGSARWKDFVLHGIIIAFVIAFAYIGPAVVCLYSATEDTHEEICQIKVESPVGFRSLIRNYFFSAEYTMWRRARKFIMHVVLLPIPFLAPAIFVEYLLYQNLLPDQNILDGGLIFRPFRILCYGCYVCNAFYFHIIRVIPPDHERSRMYNINTERGFLMGISFYQELPQRMLAHLRVFGFFIYSTCGVILAEFASFVKDTWRSSSTPIRRIIVCLLFAAIFPIIPFIILMGGFHFLCHFIMISFPISVLCSTIDVVSLWGLLNIYFLHRDPELLFTLRTVAVLLDITLSWFAALGAMFVLRSAAVGALIFLQLAVAFVLSEDNLPFVACCVSISYYLWSSYSRSVISKYQDLAINLYEHCDRLWPDHYHTTDNAKTIPKELFDMACEELMPIRKSICILLVKTFLSTILIFLVFSFTRSMNTSSMMKCLVAFLAGTFPMIVNIYLHRRKQLNGNFEQKTLKILQEYMNSTRQRNYNFYPGDTPSDGDPCLVLMEVGMVPMIISSLCFVFFFLTWWGTRLVVVHSTL